MDPLTSAAFYRSVVQAVIVRGRDVGIVRVHGEEDIGITHKIFVKGDGEMGKEANVWDLEEGRV